ncbi:MAG: calcium-binding protein [Cyanobacteria bacterium P01_G01_bin.54]
MKEDATREERITMEAIVDAYGPEEQAMGWYYYLEGKMAFPFKAICTSKRRTSPVKVGAKMTVVRMAPEEDCEREMFVEIEWDDNALAIPLDQLEALDADAGTREAIEDWQYWVDRGYEFG